MYAQVLGGQDTLKFNIIELNNYKQQSKVIDACALYTQNYKYIFAVPLFTS